MNLLVRHGPAPGDTEDDSGELHADFTGFFLVPVPEIPNPAALFERPPDNVPDIFLALVKQIWDNALGDDGIEGCGHILIGRCDGFEYVAPDSAAGCGFTLGTSTTGIPFAPKNYSPLFAVARAKKPGDAPEGSLSVIDMAVDYRGTTGPGDPKVRAGVFNIPSE